jgi:prepilin-type processing-associated H-X9-DG protein
MEQEQVYELWNLNLRYSQQSNQARQAFVNTYFCPTRRRPPVFSVSEGWDVNDTSPPPNPANQNTEMRFSAANNPIGAVGDYAACVGDERGLGNFTNGSARDWFSVRASGAIVLAQSSTAPPPPYLAPATNAPANVQVVAFKSVTTTAEILDGTANTFLGGEKHVAENMFGRLRVGDGCIYNGSWTSFAGRMAGLNDPFARGPGDVTPSGGPIDSQYARKFGSWHPGVCQMVFCDGSVRSMRTSTSVGALQRLACRQDGQATNAE